MLKKEENWLFCKNPKHMMIFEFKKIKKFDPRVLSGSVV